MSAKDFLPSLERIKSHQKELKTFWKKGQYEVSVFISRWMGKLKHGRVSPVAQSIVKAICEELKTVGLIGRYTGDHPKYSEHLWFNNEIYMRGCKYGIAVFEGMPECDEASCNTNHNVLVEAGVMWGKGANVLVVCDPKYARELPTDLNGIVRGDYDPNEEGLKQLRKEIHDWAEKIAEKEKESEEQTA